MVCQNSEGMENWKFLNIAQKGDGHPVYSTHDSTQHFDFK
jgi:hypothetical protein